MEYKSRIILCNKDYVDSDRLFLTPVGSSVTCSAFLEINYINVLFPLHFHSNSVNPYRPSTLIYKLTSLYKQVITPLSAFRREMKSFLFILFVFTSAIRAGLNVQKQSSSKGEIVRKEVCNYQTCSACRTVLMQRWSKNRSMVRRCYIMYQLEDCCK